MAGLAKVHGTKRGGVERPKEKKKERVDWTIEGYWERYGRRLPVQEIDRNAKVVRHAA